MTNTLKSNMVIKNQGRRKAEKNFEFSPLLPDTDNAGVGRLCVLEMNFGVLPDIIRRFAYQQTVFLLYKNFLEFYYSKNNYA